MATKAKRRTLRERADEFVAAQRVMTFSCYGHMVDSRPLNFHEAMTTRQGFIAGYRAAQRDARRERKESDHA